MKLLVTISIYRARNKQAGSDFALPSWSAPVAR